MAAIYVSIDGVDYAAGRASTSVGILLSSLRISDVLDQTPNTCQFTAKGFTPTEGKRVIVTHNSVRLFAGSIIRRTDGYVGDTPVNHVSHCSCIDDTWLLNKRKIIKRYTAQSATAIAQDIISTYCSGFTSTNVQASLATIDEITFTNEDVTDALTRLAKRIGGYWYVDYFADLHFFLSETGSNPTDLTSSHSSLSDFEVSTDLSQIRTRVYLEGGGANLAAAAAVGDTAITLESTDWYETGGGTVVMGPQRVTYTGKDSGLLASNNFVLQQPAQENVFSAVCWSPPLGLFVAVSANGTNQVFTSPTGLRWTPRTAANFNAWSDVIWVPELALFVAVGSNTAFAQVMTSPDGITWTARTASEANNWNGVAWSPSLSLLVAVANSGTHRVMTSPTGTTWTNQTAAAAQAWRQVAWSPSLALFAAVCNDGSANGVMTSPDGVTWTARANDGNPSGIGWSADLAMFVTVGSTGIRTSTNGTAWTTRTAPNNNSWYRVIWIPELAQFVGTASTSTFSNQQVMTSEDGITWTDYQAPGVGAWTGIAWAASLARTVFVGSVSATIMMSVDALRYSRLTGIPPSGAGSVLYAVANGEAVNLLVQVDDTAAQAALAALVGGDGIQEDYLQDRRLSYTEALARANAQLDLRSAKELSIRYRCRDANTKSGRTIHVNLTSPVTVSGDFKIQRVDIDCTGNARITNVPTYTVEASSTKFSFEDLLRMVRESA